VPARNNAKKPYIGLPMEGVVARRYAEQRRSGHQIEQHRRQAERLTGTLSPGASILEVAPGPGYLAIEMARPGRFRVSGLDISRTFVEIATANAERAGVEVEFRRGDVADMPFESKSFDLVVCQAAFKNFSRPARALEEIHRVLGPHGQAVIHDMRKGASSADIALEVNAMALGRLSALTTKLILAWLRRRAWSPARFERLTAEGPFQTCEITTKGIELEVRLGKHA